MSRADARRQCRGRMRAERAELRDMLRGLAPEQWRAPTLCAAWNVHQLLAHLVAWDDLVIYRSRLGHLRALARFAAVYGSSFGSMRRLNARLQSRTGNLTPDELLARFAADDGADLKWLFDGSNPDAHLAEYVLHRLDVTEPLHIEAVIAPDRLRAALDGLTRLPGVRLGARGRLLRHRFEAVDVAWSRGRGKVVRARGHDILLTLAGRA